MKVALVHDYLLEYGGAERVLEALHDIYPDSTVYVGAYFPDKLGATAAHFKNWDIRTTWIQNLPFASTLISAYRIFAPAAFESLDLKSYNLVISSSNIYFAKSVITDPHTLNISYIHTPARYLYGYTTSFNYKKHWWIRIPAEIANHFLRIYDYETSQRPDILVANSKVVAARIKKFYRREAQVIYPPVDTDNFKSAKKSDDGYYLSLARLWKGKGLELIVETCTKLNLPLKVAGSGRELANLKQLAGPTIEFLGQVSDQERVKLMSAATALIVAAEEEDFGITVVESMAAGTPVIALKQGGYLETITLKTGVFFDEPTVASLSAALAKFDPSKFKPADCRAQAAKFSTQRFEKEIKKLVSDNLPKK